MKTLSTMKVFFISSFFSLIVVLSFLSCQQTPVEPESPATISNETLRKVEYQQIDYDHLTIQNSSELVVPRRLIERIGAGPGVNMSYQEYASVEPIYEGTEGNYLMRFALTVYLDSTRAILPITLKYYFSDGTTAIIEKDVHTYLYPYPNAVQYLTTTVLPEFASHFQDIDRNANKIFIHPLGPFGLYEYDITTRQTSLLLLAGGGDHLAVEGNYAFLDFGASTSFISRFNLSTKTIDLTLPTPPNELQSIDILGIAARNGEVYSLVKTSAGNQLYIHAEDGTPLGSIPYPKDSFYLTVYNNILYSLVFATDEIVRFDLTTRTFLQSRPAPTKNGDGIKVFANQFYFVDYNKRFVGRIPVEDIE